MKTIIINIADGAKSFCNDTLIGRAGEHNNTSFHIVITDESMLSCDYYRCWFGGRYSEKLYINNGMVEFIIPQDVLVPPSVDFQLCGYKLINEEPCLVVRSSILNFAVEESACCALINSKAFEPYEMISFECGSSAESAKKSEDAAAQYAAQSQQMLQEYDEKIEAEFSDLARKSDVNSLAQTHGDYITDIQDEISLLPDKKYVDTEVAKKADPIFGAGSQYGGFESDGTNMTAINPDTMPRNQSTRLITSGAVYDALKNIKLSDENGSIGYIILDTELSDVSENAVQNKAVTMELNNRFGDVEAALGNIIAIQQSLMGGEVNE